MKYTVTIDEKDLAVLSMALVELPFKVAAPLIDKLNRQIAEQVDKQNNAEKTKEN